MNEIFIKTNNRKNIVFFSFSVILVLVGVLALKIPKYEIVEGKELLNLQLICYGGIVLFTIIGILFLIKMLRKNRGIYISKEGIKDQTKNASDSFIYWKDVKNILTHQDNESGFLLFFVHNPAKYLSEAQGVKKATMTIHDKLLGTPLAIMIDDLDIKAKDLHQLVLECLEEYEANQRIS